MRALIQRTLKSSVEVDQHIIGEIDYGLCVFIGVEATDDESDVDWILKKIVNMRIFNDSEGKMNASLLDVNGGILLISQFTLHASTKKGNRPSFIQAAQPVHARNMYELLIEKTEYCLSSSKVASGSFGADMKVSIINDGPVTIWLDSKMKT